MAHIPGNKNSISKKDMLRAIKGSGGVKSEIARRLGCSKVSVYRCLKRPEWADVMEVYEDEAERVVDDAEVTIHELVTQREDYGVAFQASKLVLQSKGKGRGWEKTVTLEGGVNPLRMEAAIVNIDSLNLPIEMRRKMLQAMETPPDTLEVPALQAPADVVDGSYEIRPVPELIHVRRIYRKGKV